MAKTFNLLTYGAGGAEIDGAGFHNSTFRGKNLGSTVTPEQYAAIANGTFRDLFIGDYWAIGGFNWQIAAFNYYYNTGNALITLKNHAVVVPTIPLYNSPMNDTDTNAGAYRGSKMYAEYLNNAKTIIESAFSGHVLQHQKLFTNAIIDGKPSGTVWETGTVDLMPETMVYGIRVYSASNSALPIFNPGTIEVSQLPLFRLRNDLISNRQQCWLRDAVGTAHFAGTFTTGQPNYYLPSTSTMGVRPSFCIYGGE